jgi:hypothetical protein
MFDIHDGLHSIIILKSGEELKNRIKIQEIACDLNLNLFCF